MRVSPENSSALQQAIKRLTQGEYYAERTAEVLQKSGAALDGFVGPAMNILHDNETRNVSRQGGELFLKLRKSARYLDRGQKNQEAYEGALKQALPLVDHAVTTATTDRDRQELGAVRDQLGILADDREVESSLRLVWNRYETEGHSRLTEVQGDADGVNVSRHGRPLWDLFEDRIAGLDRSTNAVQTEQAELESIIVQLKAVDSRPDRSR